MQDSTIRKNIEIGIVAIAVVVAIAIIFFIAPRRGDVIVIDCTWSEISPDFTPQMKEACRQARIKDIQKDIQKPK
jgi:steroid 5-alpha reductase family enzyme